MNFGQVFSQDQGPNDAMGAESIAEKDAREENEIRNLFFNEEKDSVSSSQSEDDRINERLEALKESISQLLLEQKRIESLLLAKEKQATESIAPKKSSTLLITPKENNTDTQERTFTSLEDFTEKETPVLLIGEIENADDLSRTPSFSEGAASITIVPTKNTILKERLSPENPNTYLVKETIDTSSVGALKIHRVFIEKIGEAEADQALKNKKQTGKSFKGLERSSVAKSQKVYADFNGDRIKFNAHISSVDVAAECTTINFDTKNCKPLVVFNTIGGYLTSLSLPGSDRDFLLFSATINKDEFRKYFLFVLRNNEWELVIDSFSIHKSNQQEVEVPIRVDPNNPDNLMRYYSVFNLDNNLTTVNPWILREESVPKKSW
ncbi:hypothetical protein GCM10008083_13490 [Ulvibacter litoralis]|nr:hypothetical protein GCM10008083_13490 [Ulvibacter litoralis]